jgi:NAD(P)-dependent dehydrogenase (short-subunit alcohol dehydrogenase family)
MTFPIHSKMDGKVALITGGSTGIGRATALAFADAGARVVLANPHSVEAGEALVRLIHERGGQALFVQTDVSKADEVAGMVAQTIEHFGRLDYAFNNAGIGGPPASVVDTDEAAWDQVLDVNLKGVWLCMKHEIPAILGHGGAIVNMSSAGGLVGTPGLGAYTASKHGVIGLTKVAALEYAQAGIRVNAVCPGVIRTQMVEQVQEIDPAFVDMLVARHPIGRIGTPEEVAMAVLWLCSEAATFVTGIALPIDGGALAQ